MSFYTRYYINTGWVLLIEKALKGFQISGVFWGFEIIDFTSQAFSWSENPKFSWIAKKNLEIALDFCITCCSFLAWILVRKVLHKIILNYFAYFFKTRSQEAIRKAGSQGDSIWRVARSAQGKPSRKLPWLLWKANHRKSQRIIWLFWHCAK